MRLSLIYNARRLFVEYGGLDFGHIGLEEALTEADRDPAALIAIQCPTSGRWEKKLNRSGFHSQLIQNAVNDGVRDAWYAMRAYWVPLTGKLMIYQVETPSGHMIDPSESLISTLAHNLHISDKIMSIDIIG